MREELRYSGLSEREIDIYLHLVKSGERGANDAARRLGINRTVAYNTLNNLIEKGLVSHVVRRGKRMFMATDPENLLRPLREKEAVLNDTVKELKAIRQVVPASSTIEILEGKEGLKSVYELALRHKSRTFYAMGVTGETVGVLQFAFPNIVRRFEKQRLKIKLLMNYGVKGKEFIGLKHIETRNISKGLSSNAATSIFGDYVAITLEEKPIIVLIKNKEMAKGYFRYFKALWKIAKKV